MRSLLVTVLIACGSARSAPTPAPTPNRSAETPVAPAPVVTASPAPRASRDAPAVPSIDAPATPPKTYDVGACNARVKLMTQRLGAALAFSEASLSYVRYRAPVYGTPDADLTAAPITVALSSTKSQMATDFCGAWGIEVSGARGKATQFEGKKRISRAIAHVKKRLAKDTRLNVELMMRVSLHTVGPLLDELGKLGTLQLKIGVLGAEYQLPMTDAPAWAAERIRAMQSADSVPPEKRSAALRDSFTTCEALPLAFKKIADDDAGSKAELMAREIPLAVNKCACTGVDVDALELFVGNVLAGGMKSTSDGFLELRIDPQSVTIVRASTEKELVDRLAALSRQQRTSGVKLELVEGADGVPATSRTRCAELE